MKRILLLLVLFSATSFAAYSQDKKLSKTPPEDIFSILESDLFEDFVPFVLQYIKATGNVQPYLWIGNRYDRRIFSTTDINVAKSSYDSAVLYYLRFSEMITPENYEKYLKYYQEPRYTNGLFIFDEKLDNWRLEGPEAKVLLYRSRIDQRIQTLTSIVTALELQAQEAFDQSKSESNLNDPKSKLKSNGKYYALIIGISVYDSTALNLNRPVTDAKELAHILTSLYEFDESNITLILNPSREQILLAMFALRKKVTSIDNLLIFYAGHGFWDKEASQGYWWPRNASPDNPSNWLSNSDIREQIRSIKSKHTLLISDACFSGGIFKVRGDIKRAPLNIISLYKLPSRRAMTSGTLSTVPDQSVFFDYLIARLKSNPETFTSSQALFDSFKNAVINNSLVIPQDGVISETGDEGGDFVFIKRN